MDRIEKWLIGNNFVLDSRIDRGKIISWYAEHKHTKQRLVITKTLGCCRRYSIETRIDDRTFYVDNIWNQGSVKRYLNSIK